ncbi:protein translocase subunit SECA2, chloroplastic isoform X2 [Capsicum annuum]|nr:protein translocase subunit SECA2, chloroplastic isoform X2 [Capsicum annuum]
MAQNEAESSSLEEELPECPVCLQQYGDLSTIPRVLACGHSTCQDCLKQLQNPFPSTIRCPSCTLLVKLPNPISSLPKNIDLLRFSNSKGSSNNQQTTQKYDKHPIFTKPQLLSHELYSKGSKNHKITPKYDEDSIFIKPLFRSHEFYLNWKTWVLPQDTIVFESKNGSVWYGKVTKVSNSVSSMGCVLKVGEKVSLLEIGCFVDLNEGSLSSSSKFDCSYDVKVMSVLSGLSEGVRNALELIMKASLALHVMCKVYGFWYNVDNHCVYVVSEMFCGTLLGKIVVLENNAEEKSSTVDEFVMIGLDMCQTVSDLHLRGLFLGYLGLSCFGFDKFGRVYVAISEVLTTGRRVRKILTEIVVGKSGTDSEDLLLRLKNNIVDDCVFVSPEVFFELSKLGGVVIDLGSSRHHVGYGSDVWSLACAIISLLVGKSFPEEMQSYLSYLVAAVRDDKGLDFVRWYVEWRQKIMTLIECRLGPEFTNMKEILLKCLEYNPENRPLISELWKNLRVLVTKSAFDEAKDLKQEIRMENMCNCLILGDFCQSINKVGAQSPRCLDDTSAVEKANGEEDDGVETLEVDRDVFEGLSCGQVKCIDLKGHLNCITGLAIGGGFLFSSSFDKMVNVWSLQDYSHVHSFKGHEQRVMAVAFVDYGEPLCISGDNSGAICIWGASAPLSPDPVKKLQEQQDWRYSGIHALAVSENQYVYTGSGDRSIKAWSLQDYSLACTMNGHKSVVSSLAICDEVLYSGSWDGTVRLWCLSDHSPLAVLGEEAPGSVCSVFCLAVDENVLVAAHENGLMKIWVDDILVKSALEHDCAIFSACKKEKWIFTGGWDKTIKVKELFRDGDQIDAVPLGSITCDSVVTALLYRQGKLFVGQADGVIKEKTDGVRKSWSGISSLNNWVVKDYYRLVNSVNSMEPQIQHLSDEQLSAKTLEFRRRLREGETLAHIQAEAFAVVREAAKRKLGMRHFDVQIIGGAVLHDGAIAEMKTGEGKTLVSTLAAYLNALTGEGVHVVTVNDYLAQRDAEWMGRVHRFLGLSVGLIQRGMKSKERRSNYSCDITYTNNSELGFDYLRDNLATNHEQLVMRWPKPFHFAIVDEVDSVLIDEGRNPLLISGEANKDAARYPVAARVAELLIKGLHYSIELKDNSVELTEEGIALAEMALETSDLWDENDPWARFVFNALKAKEFYKRDVQYIVRNGKALIINELTGRVEEKRRWSEGIHQAVEAKEGLKIQADSVVVAQITYQSLFKLYPRLSGMTGTAKTEEKEFLKMFQVPVIEVPTNLPNIRKDLPIQAFATARGKWEYVREEAEFMFRLGRPVLVGTTSVENSEYLSDLLKERKIPHNILNARPKYAAREADTVAQAGRKYAITISTNMAGRGTDIILGGNPKMLAKEILEESILPFLTQDAPDVDVDGESNSQKVMSKIKVGPSSLALLAKAALMAKYVSRNESKKWSYQEAKSIIAESIELSQSVEIKELQKQADDQSEFYPLGPSIALTFVSVLEDCVSHCLNEGLEVKSLGGLHVIGTSLHESRRIDNQLRGRAGRQGDPGSTRFMVSLQDEMFQKFNFDTEWAVKLISRITNNEDIPIEGHGIVKQLLSLQINAEKYFFGIRKSLVEFDEVLEVQRKHVYDLRQLILTGDSESCSEHIFKYMQAVVDDVIFMNVNPQKHPKNWRLDKILKEFKDVAGETLNYSFAGINEDALLNSLVQLQKFQSISIDHFYLPSLPPIPNSFRGIRGKTSSFKRWLAICSDDSIKYGKYREMVNFLRKYLGDFLIASYLDVIQESGYDAVYVKEIERAVLLKTLDCFWRDHLINMNRLSSAVNVRSFGHRNPLEEYKIDGCKFFISMLSATRRLTVESLLRYWSSPMESQELYV